MTRLLLALLLLAAGCGTATAAPVGPVAMHAVTVGCQAGAYPDRTCTPGTVNPAVTQDNIHDTICVPGWSTKARAKLFPSSKSGPAKTERMAAYGVADKSKYELDHLVPIEDGGAVDDVAGNLWPEPWDGVHGAHAKDVVEDQVHADICSGRITLAQGQAVFLTGAQW